MPLAGTHSEMYNFLAGKRPQNNGCWLATSGNNLFLAERIFIFQGSKILTKNVLMDAHMSSKSITDEFRKSVRWVLLSSSSACIFPGQYLWSESGFCCATGLFLFIASSVIYSYVSFLMRLI